MARQVRPSAEKVPGPPSGGPGEASVADALTVMLAAVGRGDAGAFENLYDRTATRVAGLIRRVLRDPAQSEEVAQEVFVEIWRTAPRFDPALGTAMSWMLTIAHRRAVDRVRSERAAQERNERAAQQEYTVAYDEVSDEVERSDEVRAVRSCLDSLSDVQRESLSLAYYGGFTYPDVARRLGVPLGTVKTRLRDGLLRLRTCLGAA